MEITGWETTPLNMLWIAEKTEAAKETLKGEGERVLDLMFDTRWPQEVAKWLAAPLKRAAARGDEDLARKLVQAGAKIEGVTLQEAVRGGNTAIVELLVDHGASLNDKESHYDAPLSIAAHFGDTEMARLLLLKGADVNYMNPENETALSNAILGERLSMVGVLLAAGADLTLRWTDDMSVLDMAVESGKVEIVRMLVDHGMEVNVADSDGFTALHRAARKNRVDAIELLVGAGADIEARDRSGSRPLHNAATGGHHEASLALLNFSAEVNAQTIEGETALYCAAVFAGQPGSVKVVDLLLRWGADETIVSKQGKTAADGIGSRWLFRPVHGDDERVRSLLARAPAERAWRRRGLLVMYRAHPYRLQLGGDLAGLVARVVGLEEVGVFRTIVRYL